MTSPILATRTTNEQDEQERELIARARAGTLGRDDLVLSEIIQRPVRALAARYIRYAALRGNAALEEHDLRHAALVALLECYPRALAKSNPVSYLLQVAKLTMIQCIAGRTPGERRAALSVTRLDTPLPGESGLTLADTLAAETRLDPPGTERRAALVAQAVQTLPETCRAVVERHYGLREHAPESLNAISRSLTRNPAKAGCHASTAYYHHKRALAALRGALSAALLKDRATVAAGGAQ